LSGYRKEWAMDVLDVRVKEIYMWKRKQKVLILDIIDPGYHAKVRSGKVVVVYHRDLEPVTKSKKKGGQQTMGNEIDAKLKKVAALVMSKLDVFDKDELWDWLGKIVEELKNRHSLD
jgi:hypothetical protein